MSEINKICLSTMVESIKKATSGVIHDKLLGQARLVTVSIDVPGGLGNVSMHDDAYASYKKDVRMVGGRKYQISFQQTVPSVRYRPLLEIKVEVEGAYVDYCGIMGILLISWVFPLSKHNVE